MVFRKAFHEESFVGGLNAVEFERVIRKLLRLGTTSAVIESHQVLALM